MQSSDCFRCQKPGHWAKDCPLKIPLKHDPTAGGSTIILDSLPAIHCNCGGGVCLVKTSQTAKNPNRKFYKCPGAKDCGFFKWCDEVTVEETEFRPVSVHPICPCGSGPSRKETVKEGPNAGRAYFVCCIKENFGACGFFRWEDEQIDNTTSEQGVEATRYCFSESAWSRDSDSKTISERDLRPKCDSSDADQAIQDSQSMGTENASHSRVRKTLPILCEQDRDLETQNQTVDVMSDVSSNNLKTKYSVSNALAGNLISVEPNSEPLYSTTDNVHQINSPMSVFNIRRQEELRRQISASSDDIARGFFPSFDPIIVPSDVSQLGTEEQSVLPCSPRDTEPEPPSSDLLELNGCRRSSSSTNSNVVDPEEVDNIPSSMDPSESDGMILTENVLSRDSDFSAINLGHSSEDMPHSFQYSSRFDEPQLALESGPSLLDLIDQYNSEKVRFDSISQRHAEVLAAFSGSYNQLTLLCEKASRLRKTLLLTEEQISCCEAETLEFAASFQEVSKDLSAAQSRKQAVSEKLAQSIEMFKLSDLQTKQL